MPRWMAARPIETQTMSSYYDVVSIEPAVGGFFSTVFRGLLLDPPLRPFGDKHSLVLCHPLLPSKRRFHG